MRKILKDKQVENGQVTITKGELKGLIQKAKIPEEKVGKWNLSHAKNLLARTLYMESREDGV